MQFLAKGLRGRKHGLRLPEKDFSPIYCCILDQYLGNRHAPLLSGAFVWKLPVVQVVMLLQSDQIFKVIPAFCWYRSYRWIRKLTR